MILASAGGNQVPVITQLVAANEDTVRSVIHSLNEIGLACLAPRWAGGWVRPTSRIDRGGWLWLVSLGPGGLRYFALVSIIDADEGWGP